jgi:hypothetical protein
MNDLQRLPVKAIRGALFGVVAARMAGRLAFILPSFVELRIHLAARQDVNAAALAQMESELEFLAEDAKLLLNAGG